MSATTAVPLWPWNQPQDFYRLIRKHDGSYWWAPKDVEVPADFAVVVQAGSAEHDTVLQWVKFELARVPTPINFTRASVVAGIGVAALVLICIWILTGGVR